MSQETRIVIQRINCNGCMEKVITALQGLAGVEVISTDLPSKTLHLRYEPQCISMEQMKATLAELHYPIVEEQVATNIVHETEGR